MENSFKDEQQVRNDHMTVEDWSKVRVILWEINQHLLRGRVRAAVLHAAVLMVPWEDAPMRHARENKCLVSVAEHLARFDGEHSSKRRPDHIKFGTQRRARV